MMKSFTIRSQFNFQKHPNSNSNSNSTSINTAPKLAPRCCLAPQRTPKQILRGQVDPPYLPSPVSQILKASRKNGQFSLNSKALMTGAVSVGVVLLVLGGGERALALGPEGPIMEEFWENVRRYGLYALTVSTGVLYAVFQPIVELLKNPISALLVIAIAVGGFYIVSQVLSAMVGVSEFSYQYYY